MTKEEAAYDGEFVKFGPSWAWPKPVQSHVPVLVGAAGEREELQVDRSQRRRLDHHSARLRIDEPVKLLQDIWGAAGRDGAPQIVALDFKPVPRSWRWAELGVTEVLFGMPDSSENGVAGYVERLAGKLASSR